MTVPLPAYCFTIPSIHDGTPLDCRIHLPPSLERDREGVESVLLPSKKAAIVAHPYAPLGGCMDDPVVTTIVDQLLETDFIVGTFNFRGAANSKGTTSWSGKGERDDYISVAGHMIFYLNRLEIAPFQLGSSEHSPDTHENTEPQAPSKNISLMLAGYSYGSLILTQLPPTPDILQLFHVAQPGGSVEEIILRAQTLATQTNEQLIDFYEARGRRSEPSKSRKSSHKKSGSRSSIVYGGNETPQSASKSGKRSTDLIRKSVELPGRLKQVIRHGSKSTPPRRQSPSTIPGSHSQSPSEGQGITSLPHVSTHYLLISPLLPPISHLLSLSKMSGLFFWRPASPNTDLLVRNPTLVVFGTADIFTSAHKLEVWSKRMVALSLQFFGADASLAFRWKMVQGASHFWREPGVEADLRDVLLQWISDIYNGEEDLLHCRNYLSKASEP